MPYKDPEKQKEFRKRWKAENPDKVREYWRESEKRETTKETRRLYRQSEAGKASMKRRREKYRGSEKCKARERRYRDAHGRDAYYRFTHGVTEEAFEARIVAQNGLCPIGNHPFGPRGKGKTSPCQDHDHETDENRAILCREHNVGLGQFHDSVVELEFAISYLKTYKKEHENGQCLDSPPSS